MSEENPVSPAGSSAEPPSQPAAGEGATQAQNIATPQNQETPAATSGVLPPQHWIQAAQVRDADSVCYHGGMHVDHCISRKNQPTSMAMGIQLSERTTPCPPHPSPPLSFSTGLCMVEHTTASREMHSIGRPLGCFGYLFSIDIVLYFVYQGVPTTSRRTK